MTGHTPWSEIKHKSNTKELVERVRMRLDYGRDSDALAALFQLEERLEIIKHRFNHAAGMCEVKDEQIMLIQTRVAELEEALREFLDEFDEAERHPVKYDLIRAALDRKTT